MDDSILIVSIYMGKSISTDRGLKMTSPTDYADVNGVLISH